MKEGEINWGSPVSVLIGLYWKSRRLSVILRGRARELEKGMRWKNGFWI